MHGHGVKGELIVWRVRFNTSQLTVQIMKTIPRTWDYCTCPKQGNFTLI